MLLRLFITLVSLFHLSSNASASCLANQEIEVPLNHFDKASIKVKYRFKLQKGAPEQPFIVYLPGGPGGTSIQYEDGFKNLFPAQFNRIFIDPRGYGCNEELFADVEPRFYLSSQHTRDVLSILKNLGVRDYILVGSSYGTSIATMASALSSDFGLRPPKAVVLEGVMGHVLGKTDSEKQNQRILGYLAMQSPQFEDFKDRFFANRELPYGKTKQQWETLIREIFLYGARPVAIDFINRAMDNLTSGKRHRYFYQDLRYIDHILKQFDHSEETDENQSETIKPDPFTAIWCLEQTSQEHRRSNPSCKWSLAQKQEPHFDSSNFQIAAPIYYLWSNVDYYTPLSELNYHMNNQKLSSQKTLITVEGGPHWVLTTDWALGSCSQDLFIKIYEGQSDFSDLLDDRGRCR